MQQPNPINRGHVPFVRFLIALMAGIGTGYVLTPYQPLYVAVWVMLAVALAAFIVIIWITGLRVYRYYSKLGFLVLLVLYALGWIATWQSRPEVDRSHFSHHESDALIGYVADEPLTTGGRTRFPFVVTHVYSETGFKFATGNLMLTIDVGDTLPTPSFPYGDKLIIPASYQEVPPPYNPGEMDYRGYLANKNIWHQAYLQADDVHYLRSGAGNALIAYALAQRQRLVAKFSRYVADKDALSVASTLILGYRADLSEALVQAFSNTGTIHILSVSGMHVVIVFWLLSKLLWWMDGSRKLRVAKFVTLLSGIWSYALLTGFSPSVLRASFMISFVLAATNVGRQNRIYNSIAASAFFLLLYNPKFIADIGFQLSYLAVLGIVFLLPLLQRIFSVSNRLVKPVCDYAWMSVAAQAGAGPLAAYHFHQFPLYFLPANLLVVLPASGIMYFGFVLLILPDGQLASWTGGMLEWLILLTNDLLYAVEQLPMASIGGIWIALWDGLLIYLLMVTASLAWIMRNKRWAYGTLGCIVLLVFSSFSSTMQLHNRKEIVIFNVRRNLAIGLIGEKEAWIYSDLATVDNRTIGYSVLPMLESRVPAETIHFIPHDSSCHDRTVYIKEGILQFGDTRIMVYDGKTTYDGGLEVDILLLRNNPDMRLKAILETVTCKLLILDGSNYDASIDRLQSEAEAAGVPVYVLKNNFAYRWELAHR